MEKLNFNAKLNKVQVELNAPKNQFNRFGKYSYRNAEDILGAVKPLLQEYGLILTLTDEIQLIGNRYYLKSTATLSDIDSDTSLEVEAYAREPEMKKGMDEAQITGSSSSYARKYALNGLFAIDDVKDPDNMDNRDNSKQENKSNNQKSNNQKSNSSNNNKQENNQVITDQEDIFYINELWKNIQKEFGKTAKDILSVILHRLGKQSAAEIKKSDHEEICKIINELKGKK